jgi:hypothetical protein
MIVLLCLHAEVVEPQRRVDNGSWDSIHVIEVVPTDNGKKATYKLTTTVMLSMTTSKGNAGNVNLSGSLTRQVSRFFCDACEVFCVCSTRTPRVGCEVIAGLCGGWCWVSYVGWSCNLTSELVD